MGGTSGPGSVGALGAYKASFINDFVRQNGIVDVIEFGCGNGDQLMEAEYPTYIGLDVSEAVLRQVMERFAGDETKSFFLYRPDTFRDNAGVLRAQLTLSLDVIFHLTEDDVYQKYMGDLFGASSHYVIVYSSNTDQRKTEVRYTTHRRFTDDVARMGGWRLVLEQPNPFSHATDSLFFVYERAANSGDGTSIGS